MSVPEKRPVARVSREIPRAAAALPEAKPAREERIVVFRPRSILVGLGVILGVAAALGFVLLARSGLTLIAIGLFLALALNPAVEFFQRRGLGRGRAVAAVFALAVMGFALLGLVFIPPLITQIAHFVDALPGLVGDLTRGKGPLGFLERKYHVVEGVRRATQNRTSGLTGAASPALGVAVGVVKTAGGVVIIAFLTLFMLLEGPEWRRRVTELIPDRNRGSVERVGAGIYKSVGGFVSGNLLASFLAGVYATVILLAVGVPYAFPLGVFTLITELIPFLGPLLVTVVLTLVAMTTGAVAGLVVLVLLLVYHAIEGHSLRPFIYGRALRLSALAVLMAIILGTEVAGILGALVAIPVAGAVQVIVHEVLDQRAGRADAPENAST